ncbi:MAG: GAF domain-containing protein [Dehalococcoidia bacterium]
MTLGQSPAERYFALLSSYMCTSSTELLQEFGEVGHDLRRSAVSVEEVACMHSTVTRQLADSHPGLATADLLDVTSLPFSTMLKAYSESRCPTTVNSLTEHAFENQHPSSSFMQTSVGEEATLAAIGRAISSSLDIQSVYGEFAAHLRLILPFDRLGLNTINWDEQSTTERYMAGWTGSARELAAAKPIAGTITEAVASSRRGLTISSDGKGDLLKRFPNTNPAKSEGVRSLMAVPLIFHGTVIGSLHLRSTAPQVYDDRSLCLAERVASQVSGSIAIADLHERVRRDVRQRSMLAELGRIINSSWRIEDVFGLCAELIQQLIPAERIRINQVNPDGRTYSSRYVYGMPLASRYFRDLKPLTGSTTGRAIETGEAILINDLEAESVSRAFPQTFNALKAGFRSVITVPLISHGDASGSIVLLSTKSNAYRPSDLVTAKSIGSQIAGAIANAALHEQTRLFAEQNAALAELSRATSESPDIDDITIVCRRLIPSLINADHISINIVDDYDGTFTTHVVQDNSLLRIAAKVGVPVAGSVTEAVVKAGKTMFLRDEYAQPVNSSLQTLPDLAQSGVRSSVSAPMTIDRQVIGSVALLSADPDAFSEQDALLAERIAHHIAGAIANAELKSKTLRLAEEKARRMELEHKNHELQVANDVKSRVISNVSHELRTPLTGMLAFADILVKNRSGNLDERQVKQLEMIRRGGRLLDLLIGDLLTMSRLETGNFKLHFVEFTVTDLLGAVIPVLSPLFDTRQQRLRVEMVNEQQPVIADQPRLAQVLSNLLSNASKYSTEGTDIDLRIVVDNETLTVSVRDYGIGMSEEEQAQLFTRFFRADNDSTRSEAGTGLGLHIVKSIVEMHEGSLSVESAPGCGTTMTLKVPSTASISRMDMAA